MLRITFLGIAIFISLIGFWNRLDFRTPTESPVSGVVPVVFRQDPEIAKPVNRYDHRGQSLPLPANVTFNAHIRSIMSNTCFVCHGPDDKKNDSGLRLDSAEAAIDTGQAIVPGHADQSLVYQRLMDADDPMPPREFLHQLSDYEKALFKKWIDQGARYQQHWAYAPLQPPQPPETSRSAESIRNPIDAFVFEKLATEGLKPSPRADKATLLRRLSLDLTGIPPTPAELQRFLDDPSPTAYEAEVERLLASPHYGERMAAFWLDLVRFSDTVGYHGDQNQRIFPYRDYVIDSINRNQPFDEFTRDQLAGDLLDQPTPQQLVATGLIRLNMVTREGGAQPEEYLAKYTADRVRMLGTAWLGATTGCCECHNHKYDPFSIEDFYSLGAFFDDVRQWGVYSSYGYTPNPDLSGFNNDYPFPPELRIANAALQQQIEFLERRLESRAASRIGAALLEAPEFQPWLQQLTRHLQQSDDQHWKVLEPAEVDARVPTTRQTLADHSLLLTGPPQNGQRLQVKVPFAEPAIIRAVRMEVLPDPANENRVGRGEAGHFEAQLKVRRLPRDAGVLAVRPRFVRIELDTTEQLSLAEVQVFGPGTDATRTNLASGGTATQSSTDPQGPPEAAIDGKTSDAPEEGDPERGDSTRGHLYASTQRQANPWWELDLGEPTAVSEIVIWNRTDAKLQARLNGFRLTLLDADRQPVFRVQPDLPKPSITVAIPDEYPAAELAEHETIAYAVTNRSNPRRFTNGQPPRHLEGSWRSGPARWQLPVDETGLPHVATFQLDQPLLAAQGDQLEIELQSSDIGRVRWSIAPVSRAIAGGDAFSRDLLSALQSIGTQANRQATQSLTNEQLDAIKAAYFQYRTLLSKHPEELRQLQDEIADCRSGLAMSLISQPLSPEKMRHSRVLPRGNWQDTTGKPVQPNTPHFLPGYQADPEPRRTRLDLANWLTSPDNPLTARHYVNRIWSQFFGEGLSNQLDDLGNQGQWPSHPLLLDWLASEFRDGWDRKQLVRLIVTSHTYQQQAAVNAALLAVDPYNRLLGQQAARRLEAEAVRDNALSISGLLNLDWVGGPSVFPYQPPGYYANLQFPNRRYDVDIDGRQYRRSVYMHWQRTFLHPMLTNFDAPARDECVAKRTLSNSPQQALTLLNDPEFVEASRAMASRLIREAKQPTASSRIEYAFQLAVNRRPSESERESLIQLYKDQVSHFSEHADDTEAFSRIGQFQSESLPASNAELAALSQVCRVILNLHETITRY